MRFIYRDIPYTSQTLALETISSDLTGRFFGQTYQIRHSLRDFKPQLGLRK